MYAVLFSDYISFYFPEITAWRHYLLSVSTIAVVTYINVRGIRTVGSVATILESVILVPVAAMCLMSVKMWRHNPFVPLVPPNTPRFEVFGVGLALGLWLYAGYEQLSTVAEEVENPQKSYPRALALVVPISIATYFVPTACALAAFGNWQQWHTGYFSTAAQMIGGPWLGLTLTLAAAVTNISLLNSTMLTSTRMPFAMAEDGYFTPFLTRIHPRFLTPWLAIILSACIYSCLAWQHLTRLISVYVWLRIATSVLTVLSAWQLRRKQPELPRPFQIPWGSTGLAYAVIAPLLMSGLAMLASNQFALRWGPAALLLGPMAYLVFRRPASQLTS